MKQYIFLTSGISNMGGAQMFITNKSKYLRNHGWNISVFFANRADNVLIPDLLLFKNNCIPELQYGIAYFNKKKRRQIVERIIEQISSNDEVVVESQLANLTFWGELVANKTRGKHLINCIEEKTHQLSPKEAAFFEWKLIRWEILNAGPKRLKAYFGSYYKESYASFAHSTQLFCSNVVSKEEADIKDIKHSDFTILSIGRLDKPYIMPTMMEIAKFARGQGEKTFNLFVIGGSVDGACELAINRLFESVPNVHVYHFGYLYPVPLNIVLSADVAVASSNSILVSSEQGIPTIAIDMQDYQPIGIYGRTTNNKNTREKEQIIPASEWLKRVLIEGEFKKEQVSGDVHEDEFDEIFKSQEDYIYKSPCDGAAYDVESMYNLLQYIECNIKRIIHKLIER